MSICRFFLEGRCKFGDSCRFSHQISGDDDRGYNQNRNQNNQANYQQNNRFNNQNRGGNKNYAQNYSQNQNHQRNYEQKYDQNVNYRNRELQRFDQNHHGYNQSQRYHEQNYDQQQRHEQYRNYEYDARQIMNQRHEQQRAGYQPRNEHQNAYHQQNENAYRKSYNSPPRNRENNLSNPASVTFSFNSTLHSSMGFDQSIPAVKFSFNKTLSQVKNVNGNITEVSMDDSQGAGVNTSPLNSPQALNNTVTFPTHTCSVQGMSKSIFSGDQTFCKDEDLEKHTYSTEVDKKMENLYKEASFTFQNIPVFAPTKELCT